MNKKYNQQRDVLKIPRDRSKTSNRSTFLLTKKSPDHQYEISYRMTKTNFNHLIWRSISKDPKTSLSGIFSGARATLRRFWYGAPCRAAQLRLFLTSDRHHQLYIYRFFFGGAFGYIKSIRTETGDIVNICNNNNILGDEQYNEMK